MNVIIDFFYRYAIEVCVGDEVLIQGGEGLMPEKVINVSNSFMQGNCIYFTINHQLITDQICEIGK